MKLFLHHTTIYSSTEDGKRMIRISIEEISIKMNNRILMKERLSCFRNFGNA
jgi:hypothetical protein